MRCLVSSFITYTHYGVSVIQNLQLQTEKRIAKLILSLTCSLLSTKISNSHGWILIVFYHGTYMHHFQISVQIFSIIIDYWHVYMYMYNWKAKWISCILFDSYSSFKLWVHMNMIKWWIIKTYAFIFWVVYWL